MTIAVDLGSKARKQTNFPKTCKLLVFFYFIAWRYFTPGRARRHMINVNIIFPLPEENAKTNICTSNSMSLVKCYHKQCDLGHTHITNKTDYRHFYGVEFNYSSVSMKIFLINFCNGSDLLRY